MKKILLSAFIAALFSGCDNRNEPFTGYLVAKEYRPERMSNEPVRLVDYAAFVPPRVVTVPHSNTPQKIEAEWIWFVANKREVLPFRVSEQMFDTKKCGDKVTMF